ncbi:MAG: hypothetical protein P1V36_02280 [Planctomycetota bacterium]|nr:hypothetical protein [Planctomycetota bacterium]
MRHVSLTLLVLVCTAVLLGGCGEDSPPPAPPPVPLPEVPTISAEAKAAYALERLERGPGSLGGLLVPEVHRRNLDLAIADLVFYEHQAESLLAEPAPPEQLVVAWAEPVLGLPLDEVHHTLRLEAVRVLGLVQGQESGELLLRFFAQSPADREISMMALVARARRPAQRERAFDIALREGTASLWENAPARVAAGMPEGELDQGVASAVAWWHALSSGSGPRMDTMLPHLKSQPWTQARLGLDASVPPRVVGPDGAPRLRYGSIDSHVAFGSGWFTTPLSVSPEQPAHAEILTGKLPAGEARCLLASLGFPGYAHAVRADLELAAIDEGLYFAAKHCMLEVSAASEEQTIAGMGVQLGLPGWWTPDRVRRLQRHVAAITSCGSPEVWSLLEDILRDVRPLNIGRPVIEQAYDLMYQREDKVRVLLSDMLQGDDAGDAGVALHLIRRARDPEYLDLLEAHYDATEDPVLRGVLQRTLTYIYSAAVGVEPARYATFVKRYLGWLDASDDATFRTLASGLLDFGDAGSEAFARGLEGPKRALYVQAWPRDRRLVTRRVAEAALAPLDRQTPQVEMNHVLGLAWSSFPNEAAPALEALRRRLPAARRGPVDAALQRVLHRAPRHGDA